MTAHKHLKARVRARMAQTGERYVTARRHVMTAATERADAAPPSASPVSDHGYALRGGIHPDTAAVVERGDEGAEEASAAATELWRTRAMLEDTPPDDASITTLFAEMAELLEGIYEAETAAAASLQAAPARSGSGAKKGVEM